VETLSSMLMLVATPARATTAAMIRMSVAVKTIMAVTACAPGRNVP
jgi:hypothetical protein